MTNPIQNLNSLGQSVWYDNIERKLLINGELGSMIRTGEIMGVTSNPSIFHNAISNSDTYNEAIQYLTGRGNNKDQIYELLAIEDIREACDLFQPLYLRCNGEDGYVSLEVNPYLAHDTEATVHEAIRLWKKVDRQNLMIKIPATKAGLPAVSRCIAAGINVNVTLLFSINRYIDVMEAYLTGLETRVEKEETLSHVSSVASFFISRIDTIIDQRLLSFYQSGKPGSEGALDLIGKLAVASAKLAYQRHKEIFAGQRFLRLKHKGARIQRPLWASTSTKNPAFSDIKYVEELIGRGTVNTLPHKTLDAYRSKGNPHLTLEENIDQALEAFDELEAVGISLSDITHELEEQGVKSFANAFTSLLDSIEERREQWLDS